MLPFAFALALTIGAAPLEGDCLLSVLGQGSGSAPAQALARSFGLTDPGSLLPWKQGVAVGRDADGRITALTLYAAQPDDGYGVQDPFPVRFARRLPLGLAWDFNEAKILEVLGPAAARVPDQLVYVRPGYDLRLEFVNGKLDRVRAVARVGATPATCVDPPAMPEPAPDELTDLQRPASSTMEGNCLFSLLGAPSARLPEGVSAQLDGQGRVRSLELALGKPGRGFAGELPVGLPHDAVQAKGHLEPALFPATRWLRYLASLGVEVELDDRAHLLRLTRLGPPGTDVPYRCRVPGPPSNVGVPPAR